MFMGLSDLCSTSAAWQSTQCTGCRRRLQAAQPYILEARNDSTVTCVLMLMRPQLL